MPFPVVAAIGAGAALGAGAIGAASTGNANRKNREFQEQMYNRQYRDNIDFWEMQNAYNTPEAQMQRYKEAGLNPNLIYGQGNSGNAGSISTPDAQRYDHKTPDYSFIADAGHSLANYVDFEIKSAQLANMEADKLVKLEEALLKGTQRENIQQNTTRSQFDLGLETELRDTSLDMRRESLRKLKQDMDLSLRGDERAAAANQASLKESAQKILTMRLQRAQTRAEIQRIKAATTDTKLASEIKRQDIELKKLGIQPNDPIYLRVLGQLLSDYTVSSYDKSKSNFFLESNPQFKHK